MNGSAGWPPLSTHSVSTERKVVVEGDHQNALLVEREAAEFSHFELVTERDNRASEPHGAPGPAAQRTRYGFASKQSFVIEDADGLIGVEVLHPHCDQCFGLIARHSNGNLFRWNRAPRGDGGLFGLLALQLLGISASLFGLACRIGSSLRVDFGELLLADRRQALRLLETSFGLSSTALLRCYFFGQPGALLLVRLSSVSHWGPPGTGTAADQQRSPCQHQHSHVAHETREGAPRQPRGEA